MILNLKITFNDEDGNYFRYEFGESIAKKVGKNTFEYIAVPFTIEDILKQKKDLMQFLGG